MIGRLLRSADFERVLRTRTRASSAHFAVHHLPDRPSTPHKPAANGSQEPPNVDLSTTTASMGVEPVDESAPGPALGLWLGAVVPKRHARRSVTRTLLKRQIRAAVCARADVLRGGLWIVRLRAPFDRSMFPSAASNALKSSAREELEFVLSVAAQCALAR